MNSKTRCSTFINHIPLCFLSYKFGYSVEIHKTSLANSKDFFVTFGLKTLRLFRLKVLFEADIIKG